MGAERTLKFGVKQGGSAAVSCDPHSQKGGSIVRGPPPPSSPENTPRFTPEPDEFVCPYLLSIFGRPVGDFVNTAEPQLLVGGFCRSAFAVMLPMLGIIEDKRSCLVLSRRVEGFQKFGSRLK
ncbi:hypothetical protein CDAR_100771 [Caerostris darwini]|uniref:Uncharacterized protein n=1 Tax=Caerostris darwini TaxID=1538125 RepID=A0AAV4VVV7_9ARAC|nr:hypothetical protein CDAR_100771 [Caerostris darwini]